MRALGSERTELERTKHALGVAIVSLTGLWCSENQPLAIRLHAIHELGRVREAAGDPTLGLPEAEEAFVERAAREFVANLIDPEE